MSRWTKHLLAVVVVASLVVGAVAGRALAQAGPGDEQARPRQEEFLNRVAAGLGVPVEERKEAIQYAELEMLDEAIEEGGSGPRPANACASASRRGDCFRACRDHAPRRRGCAWPFAWCSTQRLRPWT